MQSAEAWTQRVHDLLAPGTIGTSGDLEQALSKATESNVDESDELVLTRHLSEQSVVILGFLQDFIDRFLKGNRMLLYTETMLKNTRNLCVNGIDIVRAMFVAHALYEICVQMHRCLVYGSEFASSAVDEQEFRRIWVAGVTDAFGEQLNAFRQDANFSSDHMELLAHFLSENIGSQLWDETERRLILNDLKSVH
jgi:hypothetical protein